MKTKVLAWVGLLLLVPSLALGGAVGGPRHSRDTVLGKETDSYVIVFEGKEPANVTVRGDGSTDLDCYVTDSGGHEVVKDDDDTDTCLLQWTPAWTGKFKIRIVNRGSVPNEYRVNTN